MTYKEMTVDELTGEARRIIYNASSRLSFLDMLRVFSIIEMTLDHVRDTLIKPGEYEFVDGEEPDFDYAGIMANISDIKH